jgi:hypothetical protein
MSQLGEEELSPMSISRLVARAAVVPAVAVLAAVAACTGRVGESPAPPPSDASPGKTAPDADAGPADASVAPDASAPEASVPPEASAAVDAIAAADVVGPADASCGPPPSACAGKAGTLSLPFAQYPALEVVDQGVLVQDARYMDPSCGEDYIIVFQTAPGQFAALSGSSTELCCNVRVMGSELVDDCHNGIAYDFNGHPIGDAYSVAPLQVLTACADGCGVYVALP